MKETVVISVDYESPSANQVARDIWSALSRAALNSGLAGITARWEKLREQETAPSFEGSSVSLFVIGQDRPEAVEHIRASGGSGTTRLYGVVVATPQRPSPLAGSLLYQGVGCLTGEGVRVGAVLPALIPVSPKTECEAYAARIFGRLQETREPR
ncbi:MAG: hypothetical protein WA982_04230 [Rubrobacteraceae bacterium]